MSIELIIQATEDLDWKQCEQSGMWRTTDGEHSYWIDTLDDGYYAEVIDDPDYTDRWFKHHNAVIQYLNRFSDPFMVLNSSKCTVCDTVLKSLHRHDFVGCKCEGGGKLFIDGGNAYKRMVGVFKQALSLDVMSNAHHGVIRESFHIPMYKKGDVIWKTMTEINDKQLDSIITYMEDVDNYNNPYYSMYLAEKDYRRNHKITIKD